MILRFIINLIFYNILKYVKAIAKQNGSLWVPKDLTSSHDSATC